MGRGFSDVLGAAETVANAGGVFIPLLRNGLLQLLAKSGPEIDRDEGLDLAGQGAKKFNDAGSPHNTHRGDVLPELVGG